VKLWQNPTEFWHHRDFAIVSLVAFILPFFKAASFCGLRSPDKTASIIAKLICKNNLAESPIGQYQDKSQKRI
jgi:hypothetical protein